ALSACSGSSDDDIGAQLDEEAAAASTSTTEPTTTSSSTTTEPTTTTRSEEEAARAEIERVVTEWYQFPIDYSLGEEGLGLEQTTGLLRQRILESAAQLEAEGQVLRSLGVARIEITGINVDLEDGTAEVDACTGSSAELLNAETLEVITRTEPDTSTSLFQLRFEAEQWKISEWVSSGVDGDPISCDAES
ncbi:MAG: hypothetical protein AAGA93_24160, partial [Actinomycetota bacterium]